MGKQSKDMIVWGKTELPKQTLLCLLFGQMLPLFGLVLGFFYITPFTLGANEHALLEFLIKTTTTTNHGF